VPDGSSGFDGNRRTRLGDQLLGGLIQTDERTIGISRLLAPSEVPLFKGLIQLFEKRLKRRRGTSSAMVIHTTGSVHHFSPIPTTMSLLARTPFMFGAFMVLLFIWGIAVVPLINIFARSHGFDVAMAW
jgi:hypothetical protein